MLHPFRQLTFRPAAVPGILSPITVRSTGHYRLGQRVELNPPRPFTQLFWVVAGTVTCGRDGTQHGCPTGSVFWYSPLEAHRVASLSPEGEYFWITFDGGFVADWLRTGAIGPTPRAAGPCPVELFEEIRSTISLPSVRAEKQAAELGLRLLMAFVDHSTIREDIDPSHEEQVCRDLETRISRNFRNPDFGVETAAREMRLHRTTLFRIYRDKRGITPSAFLQRTRLRHGLELLREGFLTITEVALASGYRDPNYFSKVIRRATGESPRRVRNTVHGLTLMAT